MDVYNEKMTRNELILGHEAMQTLKNAKVVIAGLGGVGGAALESLARFGIGNFLLFDIDEIRYSNFNRQWLATEASLGKSKADTAYQRILSINSDCHVVAKTEFLDERTFPQIGDYQPDVVIDAIDSLSPKVFLIRYCVTHQLTVLSAMGAANRQNPMAVRWGDISQTKICPLARFVRKRLKKLGIDKGVPCVYSDEIPLAIHEDDNYDDFYEQGRTRHILGSLPTLPAMYGLILAHHAVQAILKKSNA